MQNNEELRKQSSIKKSGQLVIDMRQEMTIFDNDEPDTTGEDPILDWVLSGAKPAQAGIYYLIAGERDLLPDFAGSKPILLSGAAYKVSAHVSSIKREFELKNGKTYVGRAYVAPIREETGEDENDQDVDNDQKSTVNSASSVPNWLDEKVIATKDPEAYDRAVNYLFKKVPGYIWGRLLTVAEQEPNELGRVADELKDKIDEMVERLS